MSIGLSLPGTDLQVELITSLTPELPRIRVEVGAVEYTAQGSIVGSGTHHEPFHIWNCDFLINRAQMNMLTAIYSEHDRLRRLLQTCDVLIEDLSEAYAERAPRTRALAINAPPVEVIGVDHIVYYAQFKGWFVQEPRFSKPYKHPKYFQVRFTMSETEKVPA